MEEETEKHHMKGKVTYMINKLTRLFDSKNIDKTNKTLLKMYKHTLVLTSFVTMVLFISTYLGVNIIDKNKYPDIYNSYENFYDIYIIILITSIISLIAVALISLVLCMYCSYIIWKKNKNKE